MFICFLKNLLKFVIFRFSHFMFTCFLKNFQIFLSGKNYINLLFNTCILSYLLIYKTTIYYRSPYRLSTIQLQNSLPIIRKNIYSFKNIFIL
jgi:hypothetical protein